MSRRMVQYLKFVTVLLGCGVAFSPLTCVRTGDAGLVAAGAMGVVAESLQSAADTGQNNNGSFELIEHRSTGG